MMHRAAHPITAYLALGSNLGDRAAIIESAIASLRKTIGIDVRSISTIIETAPVGVPNQGPYFNAAVELCTTLSPRELLQTSLAIEKAHGRDRNVQQKWGPRLLDIDVLIYGDQVIDEAGPPRLRVPHPHMMDRLFVLQPLSEIAPALVHPVEGVPIQFALDRLRSEVIHSAT